MQQLTPSLLSIYTPLREHEFHTPIPRRNGPRANEVIKIHRSWKKQRAAYRCTQAPTEITRTDSAGIRFKFPWQSFLPRRPPQHQVPFWGLQPESPGLGARNLSTLAHPSQRLAGDWLTCCSCKMGFGSACELRKQEKWQWMTDELKEVIIPSDFCFLLHFGVSTRGLIFWGWIFNVCLDNKLSYDRHNNHLN